MACSTYILLSHPDKPAAWSPSQFRKAGNRDTSVANLLRFLQGIQGGAHLGTVYVGAASDALVAATGTVEPSQSDLTAGDILYVGSVGFVATNAAVTLGDATFDMRTSDAAVATSIAAQVNAHASLTGVLTAAVNASDNTKVDLTADLPGVQGNHITLAKVDTTDAALVLNGLANTVHQSTLLNGTGVADGSALTFSYGQ